MKTTRYLSLIFNTNHNKSVALAIADGDYGVWSPTPAEQALLMAIFSGEVCDFSQPYAGLPPGR